MQMLGLSGPSQREIAHRLIPHSGDGHAGKPSITTARFRLRLSRKVFTFLNLIARPTERHFIGIADRRLGREPQATSSAASGQKAMTRSSNDWPLRQAQRGTRPEPLLIRSHGDSRESPPAKKGALQEL